MGLYPHQDVKFKFSLKLLKKAGNLCLIMVLVLMVMMMVRMMLIMMLVIMMMAMIMSPGGSELDPLVEESPIVELAEKTRLGDRVRGVTLSKNIFECSFKYLIVFVSLYTAVHKAP